MPEAQPARKPLTGESFDRGFTAVAQSQITQRILHEAYDSDYVEEVEPTVLSPVPCCSASLRSCVWDQGKYLPIWDVDGVGRDSGLRVKQVPASWRSIS